MVQSSVSDNNGGDVVPKMGRGGGGLASLNKTYNYIKYTVKPLNVYGYSEIKVCNYSTLHSWNQDCFLYISLK